MAALCWRKKDGEPQVLLITSRETGRWVLPKGWPMRGLSNTKAAQQEAWEEAGVTGDPGKTVGYYLYEKILYRDLKNESTVPCRVEVIALKVTGLAKRYPESKQRQRKWFSLETAATKVHEPELIDIFKGLRVKDLT
nr:NUDIX hydrolase [Falsirhodobacter sp. alg1]